VSAVRTQSDTFTQLPIGLDPDVVDGFIGFILAFGYYTFEVGEQVLVVFISRDQAFGWCFLGHTLELILILGNCGLIEPIIVSALRAQLW
jgi:hypothetical protein